MNFVDVNIYLCVHNTTEHNNCKYITSLRSTQNETSNSVCCNSNARAAKYSVSENVSYT